MKKYNPLIVTSAIILLFNGIPALLAGGGLIYDPSGQGLGMDTGLLANSPFNNFLIPGMILFLMNGVCSFIVFASILRKRENYPRLILCQGVILTMWIAFQIMLITDPSWLQLIYGFAGIFLMTFGLLLEHAEYRKKILQEA